MNEHEAARRYRQMKDLINGFVYDYAGKGLMVKTPSGMGANYLLKKFAASAGLREIRGPVTREQFASEPGRCICTLPGTVSPRDFFRTAGILRLSLLVFENYPRAMHPTFLEQPLRIARSQSSFWGGIAILATEEDVLPAPALRQSFQVFQLNLRGLLPVLEIAEMERKSIADRLSETGSPVHEAEVSEWIRSFRDVLFGRARELRMNPSELADDTTLSLHQFISAVKLFPLLYTEHEDEEIKRHWIAHNLGFKDLAGITQRSAQPVHSTRAYTR